MRSVKRLNAIRKLPYVRCGSLKFNDELTVPLYAIFHGKFDRFELGTIQESETMFERLLKKTERMLKLDGACKEDMF